MAKDEERLPLWQKLVYGSGDFGLSSFNTLRLIFYAIFLTDVVGLDPRLASFGTLVGIIWDAINDPIVGLLSDRIKNERFGKRRSFLVTFGVPFGLGFMILWWAPPFESDILVLVIVTLAFMLTDTLQSLVSVPYFSMTPELTPSYNERTSITSYRMLFNLLGSLVVAILAPTIVKATMASGASQQQGYLVVSAMFGVVAMVPFLLIAFLVKEQLDPTDPEVPLPFREVLATAWENVPFRFAAAIYMLNWLTFDFIALMLPYFLTYWVADGDLLATTTILGTEIALESLALGVLLITAVLTLPLWNYLSNRYGKRRAYIAGLLFWAAVQIGVLWVSKGNLTATLIIAVLAGIGASAGHILPDAIFPDVMEWDELRVGHRHEGIYYGVKNFTRKLTGAFAIFVALQVLGWFGYQAPPEGALVASQTESTLTVIRVLTGPVGAALLLSAAVVTWFYPLTREKHGRIRHLLAKRQARLLRRASGTK
ncbi:MAG: glycoside-pentoside-hexuronide (GPH):cation symporter [Chloroflexota bacterium]